MAAPKGNQFWRNIDPRKLGRNPKYKTPGELWKDAVKYFEYIDGNPMETEEEIDGHNANGSKTEIKIKRHKIPYTWEGLYVFIGVCDLDYYKTNEKKKEAFSGIIKHINNIIRNQKFSGASAGLFNANIIARDLGLTDKTDITTKGEAINQPLTPDEIQKTKDDLANDV